MATAITASSGANGQDGEATGTDESSYGDFNVFFLKRPKHVFNAVFDGCLNLLIGVTVGGVAMIYLPLEALCTGIRTSSESYVKKIKDLMLGLVKGVGFSMLVGLLAPLAGFTTGAFQIFRGALNTPFWIGNELVDGKEWDPVERDWYNYHLDAEAENVLSESEEEHIKKLQAQAEKQNEKQENPRKKVKEDDLYKLLNVDVSATSGEIKKQYYIQARKCHPDKNQNDPEAKERFQKIGEAYQILSDAKLRKQYDLLGKEGVQSDAATKFDPVLMFSFIFGSEKFGNLIGELYYSMLITSSSGLEEKEEESEFQELEKVFGGDVQYSNVLKYKQMRREVQCAVNLAERIDPLFQNGEESHATTMEDFERGIKAEAEELSQDVLGKILLGFIGRVYIQESERYVTKPYGISTFKRAAHVTLLVTKKWMNISQIALKVVYTFGISRFFKKKTEEEKNELDQAQELLWKFKDLGMQFVWNSSILDVDSTLKTSIRKLLLDKSVSNRQREHRAKILAKIGEVYVEKGLYSTNFSSNVALTAMQTKFTSLFGEIDPSKKSEASNQEAEAPALRKEMLMGLKIQELKELYSMLNDNSTEGFALLMDKEAVVEKILELHKKSQ